MQLSEPFILWVIVALVKTRVDDKPQVQQILITRTLKVLFCDNDVFVWMTSGLGTLTTFSLKKKKKKR